MKRTVKIRFVLDVDDGFPPVGAETMHASAAPQADVYVVDNTPFFALGVALGDHVAARPASDGVLEFESVIRESGAKAISIIHMEDGHVDVRAELTRKGCYCETGRFGTMAMLAVSVPPECSYAPIRDFLAELEDEGAISYSELAL